MFSFFKDDPSYIFEDPLFAKSDTESKLNPIAINFLSEVSNPLNLNSEHWNMEFDTENKSEDIKLKRSLGKERSKRCRDKKKMYLEELEFRVKELEKENKKLQNIIESYKASNEQVPKPSHGNFAFNIGLKNSEEIINKDGFDLDGVIEDYTLKDLFENEAYKAVWSRLSKIDSNFKTVIDELLTNHDLHAITSFDANSPMSFEEIKKLSNLSKFRLAHYKKENIVKPHEEVMANIQVTKRQYKFIHSVFLPEMIKLKNQYKEGIQTLLKARDSLMKTVFKHFSMLNFFVRWGMFQNEQIIRSQLSWSFATAEQSNPFEIWGIKKEQINYKPQLFEENILDKWIKNKCETDSKSFQVEMNSYSIES